VEPHGLRAGLLRNLGSGFALLCLRRRSPDQFAHTFDQLAVLLGLNLLIWAGLDTVHAEVGSELRLDGLYGWSFYLLMGLFGCGLVARAYCRQADTRSLLIPTLSVAPYVLIAFWLLTDLAWLDERPAFELVAAILYLIFLSIRLIQAAYTTVRTKAVVVAVILAIAAPVMLRALDLDTRLWLTDDVEPESQVDEESGTESLLYEQPARIVSAVEQMTPREPGNANVFFIGFAGDGEQGIFKREALFADSVLAEHFGSQDRSLELINDNDDRDSYPIASVSGLQQALKLVASHMDLEQDVAVLMLTSHGSREGLAVANGSLPLAQLGPAELRRALDEAGIKWRIVIVSACYSGVFVDALKGDDSLVITAADAEHSSFGCDDDRELTYFGEAFLKDSIPNTSSLEDAFRKASTLIQKREASEHKTRSNPQMAMGAAIRQKLAEIEGKAAHSSDNVTVVSTQ